MATPQGRLGRWGEDHARRHLEGKGYSITATDYCSRWGEVDIVARLGDEYIFVEVKTCRGSAFGTPGESITATKSQRLIATAQDYLQKTTLSRRNGALTWSASTWTSKESCLG